MNLKDWLMTLVVQRKSMSKVDLSDYAKGFVDGQVDAMEMVLKELKVEETVDRRRGRRRRKEC